MTIVNIDNKGRVNLGPRFANRTVIVEEIDETSLRIKMVHIPEREQWLYDNDKALASVHRGLNQARAGKRSKGPKLPSDEAKEDRSQEQ
jgi:hypothetical protein